MEQRLDQAATLAHRRLLSPPKIAPFDGAPKFALGEVNFSTLQWPARFATGLTTSLRRKPLLSQPDAA